MCLSYNNSFKTTSQLLYIWAVENNIWVSYISMFLSPYHSVPSNKYLSNSNVLVMGCRVDFCQSKWLILSATHQQAWSTFDKKYGLLNLYHIICTPSKLRFGYHKNRSLFWWYIHQIQDNIQLQAPISMTMSCHGNDFHISGPVWGESTGHWLIPLTMSQ